MSTKVTYRQQYTRCGKQRCRKCREGAGHGPYWYAYWSEKGRTVSKYIGARLPEDIAATLHTSEKDENAASRSEGKSVVASSPAGPVLRVYLLGQFRIERKSAGEWHAVDNRTWHRRRARALLGCLLSSPGRRAGREQVMELLWPDLDIDIAANRLNGAVHELRQILEPDIARPAASRMLRLERDVLELADSSHIWVDAEAFEALIKEAGASTDPEQTEQKLKEAAALYGGSYLLEELYSEWAAPRRDALQRAYIGLLLDLADMRAERGAFASAIETLDRLRTADPANETALQRLMILLTHLDRRGEALQVYRQHVAMVQRDYESEPLPETVALFEALRKGHMPTVYSEKAGSKTTHPLQTLDRENEPAASTTPGELQETALQDLSFTRPAFQLGRHNQSPLIGRERERATMHQFMHAIEERVALPVLALSEEHADDMHQPLLSATPPPPKQIHFLLLKGEAGIGKTRLAEELSHEAYTCGWAVAWSRSYEQEGTIPFRPWTELLRTLLQGTVTLADLANLTAPPGATGHPHTPPLKLERLGGLLPELTSYPTPTPARSTPPVSHEQERLHLWEATLGLLSALSRIHPLLLVLDDLHWADDSSIELLAYLTHHLQDQRVLLVGTCREGELSPQHKLRALVADLQREQAIVVVPVQPLTQSQIGALLAHLPEDKVQRIQAQAAGNPFFAEELARYVAAVPGEEESLTATLLIEQTEAPRRLRHSHVPTQKLEHDSPHTSRSLPEAIAAVLERRLNKLSGGCQILLGKAAVLGGSFELRQLLPMANEYDEDAVLDLLDEALRAGLLTEEGTGAHITYHFWHPLIISHLYARLSAARRAQLHRRAAEAMRTAHPTHPEKVAAGIVYHLGKGGGDPAMVAHYAALAGHQAYSLAAYSEARQYYLQAFFALAWEEVQTPESCVVHEQIQQITAQTIVHSPQNDPLYLCRLLERVAECSMVLGNFEETRHLYACILDVRAGEHFQRRVYPPISAGTEEWRQETQIQALLWREISIAWCATGEYERAHACLRKGREVMLRAGIESGAAWACLHLQYGAMLRLEGNYHEARRYLQEALEMLEQIVSQSVASNVQGVSLPRKSAPSSLSFNEVSISKEFQTRTERVLMGDPLEIGYAHERLGIVAASLGQMNDGLKHMHIALTIYEQSDLVSEMARVCGNLGAAYITKGEHDTARHYMYRSLNQAERVGDQPNMSFVMLNLANVAQRSGDLLEAERWFTQSLALAERINNRERMSWCSVELAAVQEDLGKLQDAASSIQRALSVARVIKSTRCIRYALLGLAELRIVQVSSTCQFPDERLDRYQLPDYSKRLLLRAESTLRRTISLEGLEAANIIEGRHLLALVHFLLGDLEVAQQMALQALQEAQELETARIIARSYRLLGRILAARNDYRQAQQYFRQAIQLCRERGLHLDYARALYGYGLALMRWCETQGTGQQKREEVSQQGLERLREAHAIFCASHAEIDRVQVERALALYEVQGVSARHFA